MKLEPYQTVRATVEEGGRDIVTLKIDGRQLTANTKVPLRSGQSLNLQVVATSPGLLLRIVEDAELKYLFRGLHFLGQKIDLSSLLEKMRAGFEKESGEHARETMDRLWSWSRFLGSDSRQLTGADLSRLWKGLGLDLEALLAKGETQEAATSLKSALLSRLEDLRNQGKGTEGMENILDRFELFQLIRNRLAQEKTVFLPLPFSFLEQGYLVAERKDRDGKPMEDEDNPWKISLHLKLSFLGNLQIDLLFEKFDLRMRILCDSKENAAIVSEAIGRLGEKLSTVSLKSFSVGTGAPDPVAHLFQRLAPGENRLLEAEV